LVRIGSGKSGTAVGTHEVAHHSEDALDGSSEGTMDLPGEPVDANEDAVDSLNVSVTGAIILHHFLSAA